MALETQAAFARRIGVSKQAVADYLKRGKIDGAAVVKDGPAKRIDIEKALAQLRRRLDPDQRVSLNAKADLRKPTEPAPPATGDQLWFVLAQVPALAAWESAEGGGSLQRAFDTFMNMRLNITGELALSFGVAPPGEFEPVQWQGLAEEFGMAVLDPEAAAADWNRRRLAEG